LSSYVFDIVLTSPETDDDLIGVVAAMDIDSAGDPIAVLVWVSGGGLGGSDLFSIRYLNSTSSPIGDVIDSSNVIASHSNATSGTGWSGKQIRVRVSRSGGVISAKCSDWDATATLLENSELFCNLNDLTGEGSSLTNPSRYGFVTQSQANSTYLNYTIRSGEVEDDTRVYSEADNLRWIYDAGAWTQSGTAYQDFTDVDRVNNRLTKESFDVNTSTLQFLRNDGISYGVTNIALPASTTSNISFSAIISDYTFDSTFTIVGIFDAVNLTASIITGDMIEVTTTTTNGEFFVLMETPEVIDPETNITNKTIAFRKVNINVT
jgi:hypothetical protein